MFCPNCGKPGDGHFCAYCGVSMETGWHQKKNAYLGDMKGKFERFISSIEERIKRYEESFAKRAEPTAPRAVTLYYAHGIRTRIVPTGANEHDAVLLVSDGAEYDLRRSDDYARMPVPMRVKGKEEYSATQQLEYFLLKKSKWLEKAGDLELALSCSLAALRMLPSASFAYSRDDYLQSVYLLYQLGRYGDAEAQEDAILDRGIRKELGFSPMKPCGDAFNTDLVGIEISAMGAVCSECAKYAYRVYSVNGKDRRFCRLPENLQNGAPHSCCCISFYPFLENITEFTYNRNGSSTNSIERIIQISTRPYRDERTADEKATFSRHLEDCKKRASAEDDYKKWCILSHMFPERTPKSFSAYRRMLFSGNDKLNALLTEANKNGLFAVIKARPSGIPEGLS